MSVCPPLLISSVPFPGKKGNVRRSVRPMRKAFGKRGMGSAPEGSGKGTFFQKSFPPQGVLLNAHPP
jgi:hypothetical protein